MIVVVVVLVGVIALLIVALVVQDRRLNAQAREALRLFNEHHAVILKAAVEAHQSAVRMALTGSATATPAVVQPAVPDAVDVLSQRVAEETVQRGMDMLRAAYKNELGIDVDDKTLRAEAEQIILTGTVSPLGALGV